MFEFLQNLLLTTFVVGVLVLYKDELTEGIKSVISFIKAKTNYYEALTENTRHIEKEKYALEKFITLEVKFEKEMQYLIKEFLISKVEPFFDIPKSDNISDININEIREEFIKFAMDYIKLNKIIKDYIDIVFESDEGFIYYLILRFDSDIYEKYILDKILSENTPLKFKR